MSFKVLQKMSCVDDSRKIMIEIGASAIESYSQSVLRRIFLNRSIKLGDKVKSWDMLETIKFFNNNVDFSDSILDIGAYASEILVSLHQIGYQKLAGVDLNERVLAMPHSKAIDYRVSDFMHTMFETASFKAVTAISVIEHGFDQTALLREMSRLIRPGGYFVSSFDYWNEKIDTGDQKIFDMTWKIFSEQDVACFIDEAASFGFKPVGALDFDCVDRPIECMGRNYTFGWLALERLS